MDYKREIFILSDKKVQGASNFPVFEIEKIEHHIDFQSYDGLIFTSKNSVKIVALYSKEWQKIPSFVIAPKTAKIVEQMGGNLVYTGKKNHGDQFARELIPMVKGKKLLYLSGEKVVSNLVEILNNNEVICDRIPIYKTVCKEYKTKKTLPKNSIIIFSSPSTIECFFQNSIWDESFQAISIGETTAKYFPKNIVPIISDETSLEACIKKALEII